MGFGSSWKAAFLLHSHCSRLKAQGSRLKRNDEGKIRGRVNRKRGASANNRARPPADTLPIFPDSVASIVYCFVLVKRPL